MGGDQIMARMIDMAVLVTAVVFVTTGMDGSENRIQTAKAKVAEIAKRVHGESGVAFRTSDTGLQTFFDAAEAKAAENIYEISPGMKVLVEGGGFSHVYLETQPMGGEMAAVFYGTA
jgi:hypothetical protein